MKKVCSVSGGQTSAYLAANYHWDALVFALVQIEDKRCAPKDKGLIRAVEAKIGKEFIATAEEDGTLTAVLDLEQYIGQKIDWVTGPTFEQLIESKGGYLPNKMARFCTTELKIIPIAKWWHKNFYPAPVEMGMGFRANEQSRAFTQIDKLNANGFDEVKLSFEKDKRGRNKWTTFEWRKPVFPLIADGILKRNIIQFWKGKPVRFAPLNNCAFCHWRNPLLLKKISEREPEKIMWAAEMEEQTGNHWRSDVTYRQVLNYRPQLEFDFEDFSECDSGFCGM